MPLIYEFHVSRPARDRYQFDEPLFGLVGNVVFANFYAARRFAEQMNRARDLINFPEQVVRAGQINAMGLIDEILHLVVQVYRQKVKPDVLQEAYAWLSEKLGEEAVDQALRLFIDQYPPTEVYRRELGADEYLAGATDGVSHRLVALEELLLLWLDNVNSAFAPFLELFDDSPLEQNTVYRELIDQLYLFFEEQPGFGPDDENLIDMLRRPAREQPHSLSGQLEYIRERWGYLLGQHFDRLLRGLDLIEEEGKIAFFGPGPAQVYQYAELELEPERFSPDSDWMPRVVLIAKNTLVWLDQLSKKYERRIHTLDQVPDEELDQLSRWGITGLWLIGLWERSRASRKIKQLLGNPEAAASAYSLFDYELSANIGGETAYQNLRDRAWQRGIRLASDMVPNHMGIDSRWVMEHPDWFIGLEYSPFPSYRFSGPDLSEDPRAAIYIEDHYFNRTDAAVVFKRVDRHTGRERFIYHGNDGTSMPWNDTAQLDFVKSEVREAVIQTILHVARKFPIIRFDAAMTLAKKHFQRLWYPEPGTGGAIPSRSEFGLTKAEFDRLMPQEFWREVVDRVAVDAPDTLLLAEAFWLMEGYFVRTLGMHRVYNSAFMNMLRDEENANYRSVMKNTLEFDPEILKRFVNFMNNPDERTAVDQFGKGDKYFGVCTLMATLPGLPMFGHGQIEGFAERYGMEFTRAQWDEQPDGNLIARHEREIFPLLHRRATFAGVEHFLLYDFFTPEGQVNEDVIAYSNRHHEDRALVVYHNRYSATSGWIRASVAHIDPSSPKSERRLVQRTLGAGLGIPDDPDLYLLLRDHRTGLEFIHNTHEIHSRGIYLELQAYEYHVFIDFRLLPDGAHQEYRRLAEYLRGTGVPSVEAAAQTLLLQPIHDPLRELVHPGFVKWLRTIYQANASAGEIEDATRQFQERVRRLAAGIQEMTAQMAPIEPFVADLAGRLETVYRLNGMAAEAALAGENGAIEFINPEKVGELRRWNLFIGWLISHRLGALAGTERPEEISRSWIDEWQLSRVLAEHLFPTEAWEEADIRQALNLIKVLVSHQGWHRMGKEMIGWPHRLLQHLLGDPEVHTLIRVNRYRDVLWFNKEAYEQLLWWLLIVASIDLLHSATEETAAAWNQIRAAADMISRMILDAATAGYQVEKTIQALRKGAGPDPVA